jgi:type II secretory pathway component PulC
MAKRGFIKTIQNNSPLKKLSTTFISLALLFILSIILYFVVNKFNLEGNANMNRCNTPLEVVLITSNAKKIQPHDFIVRNDWQKIKNKYNHGNIQYINADKASTSIYIRNPILSESNYPMVVISDISGARRYLTDIKRNQLTYDTLSNKINSYCTQP